MAVVLMYHRIADTAYDPWGLCVHPRRFEEQMRCLAQFRIPLGMDELVARLESGTLPERAVGVTFDDGYLDNVRTAKPILEEMGIPATIFLVTGFLGSRREFWWDELARLTIGRVDQIDAAVEIDGRPIHIQLPALPAGVQPGSSWRAWDPPTTTREQVYLSIWSELRGLGPTTREEGMNVLRRALFLPPSDVDGIPMKREDVAELLEGQLIDIGAHSSTHPPLTTLPVHERQQEIAGSKDVCEALAGKPITGFAYPHGDLDPHTKDLVRHSGLQWACSTRSEAIDPTFFDRFDLPRLQVMNWTTAEFRQTLASL